MNKDPLYTSLTANMEEKNAPPSVPSGSALMLEIMGVLKSTVANIETNDFFNFSSHESTGTLTKDFQINKVISADDISSYSITSDGLINENWTSIVSLPSQIVEINNSDVILECLLDYEQRVLEKRKFKKSLLPERCSPQLHNIIILKISERPGKIQFEFKDGKNLGFEKYFDESQYLPDIDLIDTGKLIK